jgi:hypothetical protein
METTWKNIRSNLIKGYRSVSEKTSELTKIGRLKLEIIATKRDLEKAFIELGGRVYDSFKNHSQNEIPGDLPVVKLVEKIKEKEENLKNLEEKVEQIRDQHVVIVDK